MSGKLKKNMGKLSAAHKFVKSGAEGQAKRIFDEPGHVRPLTEEEEREIELADIQGYDPELEEAMRINGGKRWPGRSHKRRRRKSRRKSKRKSTKKRRRKRRKSTKKKRRRRRR